MSAGSTDDLVSAAMRVFSLEFDHATWPNRELVEPDRSFGFQVDGRWVSTCTAYSRRLTVPGGATVPVAAVTLVTVAPSYRRRGLLTRMMSEHLADSVARGEPVALLWASEASIYGRYGYGAAMTAVDFSGPTQQLGFRPQVDLGSGSVGEVEAEEWRAVVEPLHARLLADRPGGLTRPPAWWHSVTSDHPARRGNASPYHFALHYRADGTPDGYLAFRTRGDGGGVITADLEVRVGGVDAATAAGYARLWRFVFDLDLVRSFHATLPPDDPLPHLLCNRDVLDGRLGEGTFARLVDVPAALEARRYAAPVDVVLGVRDMLLPQNAGCYRLRGGTESAEVRRVDSEPDVELDVRELATLYLGGTPATVLARAGLLSERRPGAVAAFSAAFSWSRLPFCLDYF